MSDEKSSSNEKTSSSYSTDKTVKERVDKGVEWLEQFPGWRNHIDAETLNIRSGWYCICGQLKKREVISSWLEMRDPFVALQHGFIGKEVCVNRLVYIEDCEALTKEWLTRL